MLSPFIQPGNRLFRYLLILFVSFIGPSQARADSSLTDKENMAEGIELAKMGETQKAYDQFFKDVHETPKYRDWVSKFIQKYNIRMEIIETAPAPSPTLVNRGSGKKWALLLFDVGLGMAAAVAVINNNEAVDEYNSLLGELDNTSETNYLILRGKLQEVNAKKRAATIFSIGAGVVIGYTFLDALFIHKFFPKHVSLNIDPASTALAMKVRF